MENSVTFKPTLTAEARQRNQDAIIEEQQFNEYMSRQKQAKDKAGFADLKKHLKSPDAKLKMKNNSSNPLHTNSSTQQV